MANEFKERIKLLAENRPKVKRNAKYNSEIGSDDAAERTKKSYDMSYLISEEESEELFQSIVIDGVKSDNLNKKGEER